MTETQARGAETPLRLIATEEAFACREYAAELQKLMARGVDDLDLYRLWFSPDSPEPSSPEWESYWRKITPDVVPRSGTHDAFLAWWRNTRARMYDLGATRLAEMDA